MAKAATVELKVLAEASDAIRDVNKVEQSLDDLQRAAKEVGKGASGIEELGSAMEGLKSSTADVSEAGSGLSEAFAGGLAGGAVVAALGSLQSIVVDGFSKLGELASDTFAKALDFNTGRIKLQAQLGISTEDARKFGQLAGDLYSEAYGESIDQVNEALSLVTRSLDLNINDQRNILKSLTGDLLNIVQVFDVDLEKAVIGVSQLMKTGLAANAKEATDQMVVGLQRAGQDADELLDTIVEYPTAFRNLGLKGDQAFGLLNQALKAGARNVDQVADALKEFSLKAVTDAKDVQDAFKAINVDGGKIGKAVANGGQEASDALATVLTALRKVEDQQVRVNATAALFGAPAEDMGKAFEALDLSNAVTQLGNVEGAAKRLGDTIAADPTQKWESFKRSIETNVVRFLADNVIPAFESLAPKLQEALTKLGQVWDAFVLGFRGDAGIADVLGGSITAVENMKEPPTPMGGTMQDIKDFGQQIRDLADVWIPKLREALVTLQQTLADTAKFFRENQDAMELLKILGITLLIGAILFLVAILGSLMASLAMTGTAILLLLAPIFTIVAAARFFGVTWEGIWGAAGGVVERWEETIGDIIGGAAQAINGFVGFVAGVFSLDWKKAWDSAKDVVAGAFQAMTAPVQAFMRLLRDLLELIERATGFDIPFVNVNATRALSPAPASGVGRLAFGPGTASQSATTTINVSVQHSGLGVDSARLQRDVVAALQRYVAREGPLRIP